MATYYNEWDPFAAEWLRGLIRDGLIPPGEVDTRSITDVKPEDLAGFSQHHFFAGIGGWAFAARLAGWPDDRPIFTGSPPCQPFSVAGKGLGAADERNLWPQLFRLLCAVRPACFFGEQVPAAIGKHWLDRVLDDLEGEAYACRPFIVPACAVNAPHRRDRIWIVADAGGQGLAERERDSRVSRHLEGRQQRQDAADAPGSVAHANHRHPGRSRDAGAAEGPGREHRPDPDYRGPWGDADWRFFGDGKARRAQSGLQLLAHGVSGRVAVRRPGKEPQKGRPKEHWYPRVGTLRGFGNAIVPEVAAQLLASYLEIHP